MAARIIACLAVILGIRRILWPAISDDQPSPDGATVRRRLFSYLARKRREAPRRGRGAYIRVFLEHVQKVTRSYASGLFHCYDDPRIPGTSNQLEGENGSVKRNLRRCGGRKSTANGPGSSYGHPYMFGAILNAHLTPSEIHTLLLDVSPERYREARELLERIHAPAARRRAMLRDPDRHLALILERWNN